MQARLIFGSLAGIVATVFMSVFMLLASRRGWLIEQAPEHITDASIRRTTHKKADGASLDILTALAHLGFGALAGAVYSLSLGRWRVASVPPPLTGTLYGAAVWLTSYWGILPKLGLMPPPPRDQRRRPLVMLIAHWIYGGALGLFSPPPEQPTPRGLEDIAPG